MTHLCLHVDNLEDCVHFYCQYCGMEVLADRTDNGEGSIYLGADVSDAEPVFQLKSGGNSQKLIDSEERHFGFAVESRAAVDAIATMAKQDGRLFWPADEYLPGAYFCGVRDPNGNCVEFSYGHPVPPA